MKRAKFYCDSCLSDKLDADNKLIHDKMGLEIKKGRKVEVRFIECPAGREYRRSAQWVQSIGFK